MVTWPEYADPCPQATHNGGSGASSSSRRGSSRSNRSLPLLASSTARCSWGRSSRHWGGGGDAVQAREVDALVREDGAGDRVQSMTEAGALEDVAPTVLTEAREVDVPVPGGLNVDLEDVPLGAAADVEGIAT